MIAQGVTSEGQLAIYRHCTSNPGNRFGISCVMGSCEKSGKLLDRKDYALAVLFSCLVVTDTVMLTCYRRSLPIVLITGIVLLRFAVLNSQFRSRKARRDFQCRS